MPPIERPPSQVRHAAPAANWRLWVAKSGVCRNASRGRLCNRAADVSVRCLIVDDNASFLAEARGLLEEHGFDVIGTARSGDDALKHVAEQRLDLALIDIDLGEESGIDVAQRILDTTSGLGPKIILISARDESEYGDLIETSPAVGFLAKRDLTAAAIRSLLAGDDSEARSG